MPPSYALIALALPLVWLLGRAAAHAITRDRSLRGALAPALALGSWVLGVHVASLATGSLGVGLPLAASLLSLAGFAAEGHRRRRWAPAEGLQVSGWMWVGMVITVSCLVPASFGHWFHDELNANGHMGMSAEIANGFYPPRHLMFPDFPLRYHYGFDLVVACVTTMFRARGDDAIDLTSLALWCVSWRLVWTLGERLVGRRAAFLTPLLALWGGGIPVACRRATGVVPTIVDRCFTGNKSLAGPAVSYFFQHPWALGIPLATTVILLHDERRSRHEPARLVALGLTLAALSLSQIVLFASLLPSVVVAELVRGGAPSARRGGRILALGVVAAASGPLLGGMFARAEGLAPLALVLHAGFGDSLVETLHWNLSTFGVRLVVGVLGLVFLRRDKVLFALILAGSLFVLNSVRYVYTSDILKFSVVAGYAMGVLGSATIAALVTRRAERRFTAYARAAIAALLTLSCIATSVAFLGIIAFKSPQLPGYYLSPPQTLGANDVLAVDYLRPRVRAGDLVYRGRSASLAYTQWGGLPGPWLTANATSFGFTSEQIAARNRLLADAPSDVAPWRRQGFRFFVLDGTSDERALARVVDGWIRRGSARVDATFGPLRVVELIDR